jgi:DNA uptake protein ComE-like DNA-binding protein
MKTIEQFFRAYFYFNTQEQRGIRGLLILLFLAIGVRVGLAWFEPSPKLDFKLNEVEVAAEEMLKAEQKNNQSTNKKWVNYPSYKKRDSSSFSNPKFTKLYPQKNANFTVIDINTADSTAWVALPGVGPTLASRIIQFRNKLGAFHNIYQLTEVYGFKEDLLFDLKERISLKEINGFQFNLNQVTYEELSKHPYFKYKLSKAIVNYRKQHGLFNSIEEVKKIKLVNDSIYQLIYPYLILY